MAPYYLNKKKFNNIMILKIPFKKNSQIMFQICVLDEKVQGKKL